MLIRRGVGDKHRAQSAIVHHKVACYNNYSILYDTKFNKGKKKKLQKKLCIIFTSKATLNYEEWNVYK